MAWNDDDIQTLKHLWNKERMSAGEIGEVLKDKSRSAILGMVRRLNLDPRVDPVTGSMPGRVAALLAERVSDVELNETRSVRQCGAEMHLPPDRAAAVWRKIVADLGWQVDEPDLAIDDDEITRRV